MSDLQIILSYNSMHMNEAGEMVRLFNYSANLSSIVACVGVKHLVSSSKWYELQLMWVCYTFSD